MGQIRLPADSSHRRSHSATLPIGVIPKPTFPTIGSYDGSVRGPYLGEALGSSPRLLKACGVLALLSVATGNHGLPRATPRQPRPGIGQIRTAQPTTS